MKHTYFSTTSIAADKAKILLVATVSKYYNKYAESRGSSSSSIAGILGYESCAIRCEIPVFLCRKLSERGRVSCSQTRTEQITKRIHDSCQLIVSNSNLCELCSVPSELLRDVANNGIIWRPVIGDKLGTRGIKWSASSRRFCNYLSLRSFNSEQFILNFVKKLAETCV